MCLLGAKYKPIVLSTAGPTTCDRLDPGRKQTFSAAQRGFSVSVFLNPCGLRSGLRGVLNR